MSAGRTKAGQGKVQGFTLLEILVVMSLLSVVMLALGSALRTVAQTEERIDERLGRADEMRVATAFMRSTLERVSARRIVPAMPGGPGVLFAAGPDSVAWIGIMPARYGAGGRYFFRLGLEVANGEPVLVIRFIPWVVSNVFPDWSRAESRVLVRHVTRLVLRYQDGRATPVQWFADWSVLDRLPDQLQLEIETVTGPWPSLNFPMRVMPTGNPSLGGAAFGAS